MKYLILGLVIILALCDVCNDTCYTPDLDTNCAKDLLRPDIDAYTFHMTVHPHLDAFWIFTFQDYYDPSPLNGGVRAYFSQNNFNSVKEIFNTALKVLKESKDWREKNGEVHEKAHRSFMNSEMGFFKHWYTTQINSTQKATLKEILKTRFWEILGGGFVEHDEAGAYYDDIIDNFQLGLHWLKKQFEYVPKVAISADSFGHSQSNAAILAHIGIEGSLVERSDQHILTKNKTEFLWKAKSANGITYGVMPTVIRWAIHGYENQFLKNGASNFCQSKQPYIENLKRENVFLKRLFNSSHVLRYFGHDFQMFDQYSYQVIEAIMTKFSKEKCNKVIATYSNPTEYFQRLFQEVYGKNIKPIATREEDIFPIWDYDSGLYWTGYFTTDPYHKKIYKDAGRFAQLAKKLFTSFYLDNPTSQQNVKTYDLLERFEENVAYLQHHDGVTGTSKYTVMDHYQKITQSLEKELTETLVKVALEVNYPVNTNNPIFLCYLDKDCVIPDNTTSSTIYLKIFNSGGYKNGLVKIHMPLGVYYSADDSEYETICMCQDLPCPCTLYLYPNLYTLNTITLRKVNKASNVFKLDSFSSSQFLQVEGSSIGVSINEKSYYVSYKKVIAEPTPRNYEHLNREGNFGPRGFQIRSGKYALGNNPNKIQNVSSIKEAFILESKRLIILVVNWNREDMKTVLTFNRSDTLSFQVDTIHSAENPHLADYYVSIKTAINNNQEFFTDSNGWLVIKRKLFHHEDYEAHFDPNKYDDIDGNSYPINAFVYIQDDNDKVSVNTDRPQGVIVYKQGEIWLNYDRLSQDDGKWVFEETYRSEYMKYTHVVSVQNKDYKERLIQKNRDEGVLVQGNALDSNERVEDVSPIEDIRREWTSLSILDNVKFNVKPWNDSTLLLRLHNLHDERRLNLTLFANGTVANSITCVFLTSFFGRELLGDNIEEMSLAGNLRYKEFVERKWNLNKFTNITKEYEIFEKDFAERIILRPLEIRTFLIKNPRFGDSCQNASLLKYSGQKTHYAVSMTKGFPVMPENVLEEKAKHYLLHEQHCDNRSQEEKDNPTPSLPLNYLYVRSPNQLGYKEIENNNQTAQPEHQTENPIKPIVNPEKPTEPTKPVDPTKPTEPLKPIDPVKPNEPSGPVIPNKPSTPASTDDVLSFSEIQQLVNQKKLLTKQQKKIYFSEKARQISSSPLC